jgi:FtsZ-interacting cell division protein ZipA
MSPLREALLVAGAVFLVLLTGWEVYRSRRAAQRDDDADARPDEAPGPGVPQSAFGAGPPPSVRGASGPVHDLEVPVLAPSVAAQKEGAEPPGPEPLVDLPPDERRVIVALRLVAVLPARFVGYELRQALTAEGFVLGKFDIFHKADDQGRAYLSAASLTKPGSFDAETMDGQRFSGLSLFAVLPGPKSAAQTFDDLLITARGLNERLQGALQDERGLPLTPLRAASLKRALQAERTA